MTLYRIEQSSTKAYCLMEIHTGNRGFNQLTRTLEMILYRTLQIDIKKDDGAHKPRGGVNWFLNQIKLKKLELKKIEDHITKF